MVNNTLSLRARLAGTMAVLFVGGMVVLYLAARAYAQTAADHSYDRLLAGSALSIAETLSIASGELKVDLPYAALDMLSAAPDDRVFYRVSGPDGTTVTGYDDLPRISNAGNPRSKPGQNPPQPRFFSASYRGVLIRFVVLGRQISEPGVSGWIWVQVGQTRAARETLADELVLRALIPIGFMTMLALGLVWFGIGRALQPLRRVGEDLAAREPADLHPVAAPTPSEIAPLVDAINVFMRRLSVSIDTLRAFIAEAAHQMRTPLAALSAQAQMALVDEDQEQRLNSLRAVVRNAEKLSRLLNQLLSDATVIHRADLKRFESFDLVEMINESIHDSLPFDSRIEVHFDTLLDEARYIGDPLLLREALKNLIDNALRYASGNDGPIDIELLDENSAYVLNVADRGPGISEVDRGRLFERFARGTHKTSGAGLGLAIVRQAVEGHGGRVSAIQRAGGGLIMQLWLPRRVS